MRYLTILLVTLVASCSWSWPWGFKKTGNCLDDDSCEGTNPFEEQLVGGTWYCYGKVRNEPWDCSREKDDNKIIAVVDSPERMNSPEPMNAMDSPEAINNPPVQEDNPAIRAEIALSDHISSAAARVVETGAISLSDYSDSSWAVQLIALRTLDEVARFADN